MPDTFTPEQIAQILEEFFKVVGTRQYIGARYVPIFGRKDEDTIEWDNTAPYEPLTIVLYQGNSYTSRQFVPVGVEITNQEFWAITGNYNAQVEMYRRETAAAKAAADAAQNDIDTLLPKADFSAENTVKKYIDDSVETVQDDIDTLLPKADFSAENTVKKYIDTEILRSKKPFVFNTVAEMQNYAQLYAGAICHTNGFHASGDDGAAWYVISDTGTPNGMDVLACGNLFANLVIVDTFVTPEMFGAYGNGVHDDTANIQAAIDTKKCILTNKYLITETVYITNDFSMQNNSELILNTSDIGVVIGDNSTEYDAAIKYVLDVTLFIDGSNAENVCVALNNAKRSHIVIHSIKCPCTLFQDKYGDAGSNYENNISIYGVGDNNSNSVALANYGGDNNYNDVCVSNFKTVINLLSYAPLNINTLHPWLSASGKNIWRDSKIIDATGLASLDATPKVNIKHLYSDTYRYTFYINKIFASIELWNETVNTNQIDSALLSEYPLVSIYTTGNPQQPSVFNCLFIYSLYNNEITYNNQNFTIINAQQNDISTGRTHADANQLPLGNGVFAMAVSATNMPDITFTQIVELVQFSTLGSYTTQIIYAESGYVFTRRRAYWGSWSQWYRLALG